MIPKAIGHHLLLIFPVVADEVPRRIERTNCKQNKHHRHRLLFNFHNRLYTACGQNERGKQERDNRHKAFFPSKVVLLFL